jgi:uncharacterized protein (DUF1015 family)
VLGALRLEPPGEGILPHERTTPKDKQDRLDLLRATRTNLSPIWALSLASGLSAVCDPSGPPDARATDTGGVHHRLWRVTSPGVVDAIAATVASAPVVIADGHHRYEVGLAYQAERGAGGPQDAVLALVVELAEDQLRVGPIHRTLSGVAADIDLVEAFRAWFDLVHAGPGDDQLVEAVVESKALALVVAGDVWLLPAREETYEAAQSDLDSSVVALVTDKIPGALLGYHHQWRSALSTLRSGDTQAAVLLRPVTVSQISSWARARRRMRPRSTYFHPTARAGMVFRPVAD